MARWFRLRAVFTVGSPFRLRVLPYFNHAPLPHPAHQTRTCRFPASGFRTRTHAVNDRNFNPRPIDVGEAEKRQEAEHENDLEDHHLFDGVVDFSAEHERHDRGEKDGVGEPMDHPVFPLDISFDDGSRTRSPLVDVSLRVLGHVVERLGRATLLE